MANYTTDQQAEMKCFIKWYVIILTVLFMSLNIVYGNDFVAKSHDNKS